MTLCRTALKMANIADRWFNKRYFEVAVNGLGIRDSLKSVLNDGLYFSTRTMYISLHIRPTAPISRSLRS